MGSYGNLALSCVDIKVSSLPSQLKLDGVLDSVPGTASCADCFMLDAIYSMIQADLRSICVKTSKVYRFLKGR